MGNLSAMRGTFEKIKFERASLFTTYEIRIIEKFEEGGALISKKKKIRPDPFS